MMEHAKLAKSIENLLAAIDKHLPAYLADPADSGIANGNVAVCIIDSEGYVYGRLYGSKKARQRESFRVAWTKASQVWLSGVATGEFEKLVFTGQANCESYGILKPDLIGWEGGQPVLLDKDTTLAIGFSGLRGESDLSIVKKALSDIR